MGIDSIHSDIDSLLDVLIREGSTDYTPCLTYGRRMRSRFCGITAYFTNGKVTQIQTHDMDVFMHGETIQFMRGSHETLGLWLNRLSAFSHSRPKHLPKTRQNSSKNSKIA